MAAIINIPKKAASIGLPSSWALVPAAGAMPSQTDRGLDPIIHR